MTGLSRNTPISGDGSDPEGGGSDPEGGGSDAEGVPDEPPPPQAVNNRAALIKMNFSVTRRLTAAKAEIFLVLMIVP